MKLLPVLTILLLVVLAESGISSCQGAADPLVKDHRLSAGVVDSDTKNDIKIMDAKSPIWIPDRLIRPTSQEKHEATEKGETEKEETPVSHEETFGFSEAPTNFDPDNYADD
ncbi:hypothetical protein STEG23_004307 [Scotinomys teguina]